MIIVYRFQRAESFSSCPLRGQSDLNAGCGSRRNICTARGDCEGMSEYFDTTCSFFQHAANCKLCFGCTVHRRLPVAHRRFCDTVRVFVVTRPRIAGELHAIRNHHRHVLGDPAGHGLDSDVYRLGHADAGRVLLPGKRLLPRQNSINVAIKNLLDFCVAGIVFWAFGFALMFGKSWNGLIGTSWFAVDPSEGSWLLTFLLFQLVFCGTSTTIVSGAVAERTRFSAYLLMSLVMSGVLYPILGHWVWGGRWRAHHPDGWQDWDLSTLPVRRQFIHSGAGSRWPLCS